MPDKCTVTELLDTTYIIHKTSLSEVDMLQDFFNANKLKGKKTLNDYFVNILDKVNTIRRSEHSLIPNLEEMFKQKISERVYDIDLKTELRRAVQERRR